MNQLTQEQIELIERWIVENVDSDVIPFDINDTEAIIYNMVHLLHDGHDRPDYEGHNEQHKEVINLYEKYGVEYG